MPTNDGKTGEYMHRPSGDIIKYPDPAIRRGRKAWL